MSTVSYTSNNGIAEIRIDRAEKYNVITHDVVRELLDRAAEFFQLGGEAVVHHCSLWSWWERARTVRDGLGRPR